MFKKLFNNNKKDNTISVYAPVDGEVISLEDVPDPVFSEKMMGDGAAIKPENGTIISPVNGEIIQVFPTKHAIGLKAANGAEILIHIGLETVNLKGEGFEVFVQEGQTVQVGDKLIEFDKKVIEEKAASTITPIIITNSADMGEIQKSDKKHAVAGEDEIITIK